MYSPAVRAYLRTAAAYTFGTIGFGLALRIAHFETPRSSTLLAFIVALACSIPLAMNALRGTTVEAPVHGARLIAIATALLGAGTAAAMVTNSYQLLLIGLLTVIPYFVGAMSRRVDKHVSPSLLAVVSLVQVILIPLLLGHA